MESSDMKRIQTTVPSIGESPFGERFPQYSLGPKMSPSRPIPMPESDTIYRGSPPTPGQEAMARALKQMTPTQALTAVMTPTGTTAALSSGASSPSSPTTPTSGLPSPLQSPRHSLLAVSPFTTPGAMPAVSPPATSGLRALLQTAAAAVSGAVQPAVPPPIKEYQQQHQEGVAGVLVDVPEDDGKGEGKTSQVGSYVGDTVVAASPVQGHVLRRASIAFPVEPPRMPLGEDAQKEGGGTEGSPRSPRMRDRRASVPYVKRDMAFYMASDNPF